MSGDDGELFDDVVADPQQNGDGSGVEDGVDADDRDGDLDARELHQQSTASPDRSLTFRVMSFVVSHALLLGAVLALTVFAVAAIVGVPIPRWLRLMGVCAALASIVVGRPVAKRVKAMLWNPSEVWLVDIDALRADGAVYRGPSQAWQDWEVVDGQADWVAPHLAFVKEVDPESKTVRGTWRGTMSDRELMQALQEVYKCRQMLEDDAKRGFAIDSQAFVIVRKAAKHAVMQVVQTFESGSLPDEGDGIGEQIDQAVEQFGLENKIRQVDTDESPETDAAAAEAIEYLGNADSLKDISEKDLRRASAEARGGAGGTTADD